MYAEHPFDRRSAQSSSVPEGPRSPYWAVTLVAACGLSWGAVFAVTKMVLAFL
jgi:hypothetical protein